MTGQSDRHPVSSGIDRRRALQYSAGLVLAAGALGLRAAQAATGGIDASKWTPDYIDSIAGTIEVDTAAECSKVVPLDYKGRLTYWYVGPNEASPKIDHELYDQFFAAFAKTYPNITARDAEPRLQRDARQGCAPPRSAMRRRWSRACRSSGASSSRPRASAMS